MTTAESPQVGRDEVQDQIARFTRKYIDLWYETLSEPPGLRSFARKQQAARERQVDSLIREVMSDMRSTPRKRLMDLSRRLRSEVVSLGAETLGLPAESADVRFAEMFLAAADDFADRAEELGGVLHAPDALQAMRNMWVANSLQALLGQPVKLTSSIFAYSMLYPLTDNYLDNPAVDSAEKRSFNGRFGRRLGGEPVDPANPHEELIFRMVEGIESQYVREGHPSVYRALLGIHRSQVEAMRQQAADSLPYEADILRLSVEKGGSSVLADGYLVSGGLTGPQAEFIFGYGVLLQLLDDMQDVAEDRRNGHMTIFSQPAGKWPLDPLAHRVQGFMRHVLNPALDFGDTRTQSLKAGIERSCMYLLVESVGNNRGFYSPEYVRAMEACSPVRFSFLRKMEKKVAGELERLGATPFAVPLKVSISRGMNRLPPASG